MTDLPGCVKGGRILTAGAFTGFIVGFGLSGFMWANPYIALFLFGGGLVIFFAVLKAVRDL